MEYYSGFVVYVNAVLSQKMATVGSRSGQVTVRVGEDPRIDDESQPEDGKVGNGKHRLILDYRLDYR